MWLSCLLLTEPESIRLPRGFAETEPKACASSSFSLSAARALACSRRSRRDRSAPGSSAAKWASTTGIDRKTPHQCNQSCLLIHPVFTASRNRSAPRSQYSRSSSEPSSPPRCRGEEHTRLAVPPSDRFESELHGPVGGRHVTPVRHNTRLCRWFGLLRQARICHLGGLGRSTVPGPPLVLGRNHARPLGNAPA